MESRLGSQNGAQEILDHPWFSDIDPEALVQKQIDPPFRPGNTINKKLFNTEPTKKLDET